MSFMGYDPGLVAALRRAVRRSADELAILRSSDPEAAAAMHAVAVTRSRLSDEWQPVLDRLLASTASDAGGTIQFDPADLRLTVMFDGRPARWRVTIDPLSALGPTDEVTPDEARAIGRALLNADVVDELAAEELVWLADRLALISSSPAATAALHSVIDGDEQWARLIDRVGADRQTQSSAAAAHPDDDAAHRRVDQLDDVLTPLARIYASGVDAAGQHTSHAPWFPTVITRLQPYSAALLLRQLDLDPRVGAAAADLVLTRWRQGGDGDELFAQSLDAADDTAQLLFQWLAADSEAARLFVLRATDHPEILFRATDDGAAVAALLVAGTDPTTMSIVDGDRSIRPLLNWARLHEDSLCLADQGGVASVRATLAPALGPWLMQFSSRADDWSWTPTEAADALRWVIDDDEAAAHLVAAMAGWQLVLASTKLIGDDGAADSNTINDFAELFSAVQIASRDEEVDDAADGFVADNAVPIGAIVFSAALIPGGFAVSVLADTALAGSSPVVTRWLQRTGVLPDRSDDRAAAETRFGTRAADMQVFAVVVAVGQMIDEGKLPFDALDGLNPDDFATANGECIPRVRNDQLFEFVQGLRDSTDALTFSALNNVLSAFGNNLSTEQMC